MPDRKTYELFISHSWRYHDDYDRVVRLLNETPRFMWRNRSVPRHDPEINPNTWAGFQALKLALRSQIRPANCVLILAGMYADYSRWIDLEMDLAEDYLRPMIGVCPGGRERTPRGVRDRVNEMVKWNADAMVSAIRKWSKWRI